MLASTLSRLSMYPKGNQPAFPLHSPSAQPLFSTFADNNFEFVRMSSRNEGNRRFNANYMSCFESKKLQKGYGKSYHTWMSLLQVSQLRVI